MWYLDEAFLYIFFGGLASILLRIISGRMFFYCRKYLLPILFIAFLYHYNPYSCLFFAVLMLIDFILSKCILLSHNIPLLRKFIFGFGIMLNIVVFLIVNTSQLWIDHLPTVGFVSFLGFSYAFLKLIDLLYYAYFYEEAISLFDCAGFIFFVPVFTSGPITAFNSYKEQVNSKPLPIALNNAIWRIVIGFFKKTVLVHYLYVAHDGILDGNLTPGLSVAVLCLFYIVGYLDFSGYCDIAIGFGSLYGFAVPENFRMPFLSPSLTVFWRNWHMSLGAWVKVHITPFIKPKTRFGSAVSAFVIMLFIGLWHKFTLLFLLWGSWHGLFLFIEALSNTGIVNKKKTHPIIYYARCIVTNAIVAIGCIFFYTDMEIVMKILNSFIQ